MRIQYQKDITFKATFNKLGYVPGEIIQFILEMENPRRVLIKRIDLSMVQTCEIGRAAYSLPISRTILPKIRNLTDQQIRQKFSIKIPLVPISPSYQFRGEIRKIAVINICYMFQFTVKVEERCICYDVHIPIILGTDPNPDLSQQPTSNSISFYKEYICKHIIGMAIRLKFCEPPSSAKDIPLSEKRKQGRPQKATKALLIQ
ncbi:unnamed protein product [Rotaria sp. Silwood1]|nr:unnamed protein product [Rotaria sp. Silwood1]